MTFGMQGKDIRHHLENISLSAMSRIFKRLRLHGIIERAKGTYNLNSALNYNEGLRPLKIADL